MCQSLLCRTQTRLSFHGRDPVHLHAQAQHSGSGAGIRAQRPLGGRLPRLADQEDGLTGSCRQGPVSPTTMLGRNFMTFDLTRRGMIAGATASVPTLAFAQNKPQFAPISTV